MLLFWKSLLACPRWAGKYELMNHAWDTLLNMYKGKTTQKKFIGFIEFQQSSTSKLATILPQN
jgi:hypothetical protein